VFIRLIRIINIHNTIKQPVFKDPTRTLSMIFSTNGMKAICLLSVVSKGLSFTQLSQQNLLSTMMTRTNVLQMGYLDGLSPPQPDDPNESDPNPETPTYKSPGMVPCGRGPLGSYLDAVSSGTLGSSDDNTEEDEELTPTPKANTKLPASWTSAYLTDFLNADDSRTDIRNLLTQRSIQSFMRLLEECRDPHSAKWIQEDFLQTGNLLDYHGTGAGFIERFGGTWDGALLEMTRQPKDRIIVSAKRRGRGHGGWSKDNPFLEERWVEIPIDIDPVNLVSRILSVREQIGSEWMRDMDVLIEANDQILDSFFETMKNRRGWNVDNASGEAISGSGSFERKTVNMIDDNSRFAVEASSPFRRANFDLLYNLCTQAAIHRILREGKANGEEREVAFVFLREFYTERAEEYFDGNLHYGRADDFIDDLLQTSPSVLSTGDGRTGLVDPVGAAEKIILMRKHVATDWKALMENVSEDHTGIRQAVFSSTMERSPPVQDNNDSTSFQ